MGSSVSKVAAFIAEVISQLAGLGQNRAIQEDATPTTQTFNTENHGHGGFTTGHAGTRNTYSINNGPNQRSDSVDNRARDIYVRDSANAAIGSIVNYRESPPSPK